jgi:acyl-CoA synthetase (NDP forming)
VPDLTPLLWPRSIAVIGASPDRDIIRGRLLHIMRLRGFDGPIYPVTRSHAEVDGLPAYRSIGDVPGPVDLAIVVIPAAAVPEALAECGARGVRAAIVISSGFGEERGDAGRQREDALRTVAARHGMVVCGPNCEGLVNALAPVVATFSPVFEHRELSLAPEGERGRPIGVVSQSGGIAFAYFNRGRPRQLRFSHMVSTGNETSLAAFDYVDFMLAEGRTDVFLLYLEAVRDAAKFREVAARAAHLGKPLVVSKVGRSEAARRSAASHTGALAGSDAAYDAVFRRYGVVRAGDLDEMLDIAAAFSFCPPAPGPRVGLLSASGGGATWMADLLAGHGLELPPLDAATRAQIDALIPSYGSSQNPVDVTAQAVRQVGYARIVEILLASPVVDAVVVIASLTSEATLAKDADALARLTAAADKPILFCSYTLPLARAVAILSGGGIPAYTSMASCARALQALVGYAAFRERWSRRREPAAAPHAAAAAVGARLRAAGRLLCEDEAKELLAAYEVARPPEAMAHGEDEAAAAARAIGFPVALKVQSPDIAHKTEAGAVALGLASEEAVRAAYHRILASAAAAHPQAKVRGVLVQAMAPAGREMIVGVSRDRDFGPMLMVGVGGIHVEVLRDVALAPLPVERADALELIAGLRGAELLAGVRGEPPADVDALADLLVRLSRFAADQGDIVAEIDLNPVIVHRRGEGLSIVDALIVTRTPD